MARITKPAGEAAPGTRRLTWIFLAAAALVYLWGLWVPLLGPDEPRYSQVAREMFQRGDWVSTTLGGFNWYEKPSLLYWLQIVFYNIFGVNEYAARLGPALFGIGTFFTIYLLARNVETGKDRSFSFWAAVITSTMLGLLTFSRGASFDIIITFPMTAALASFYLWHRGAEKGASARTRYLLLFSFYFFIGVAVLGKGLIGIVFPAAIVCFYYVLKFRFPRKEFVLSVLWGSAVTVLVAAVWYLPMYLRHGWEFIDQFIIQHHFRRFTSNKYKHPQPFWFFWVIFPLMTIPWLPLFLAGTWKPVRRYFSSFGFGAKVSDEESDDNRDDLSLFALAWMLVPLVFFSASGSKLPGYVLPSLPAAGILTAVYADRWTRRSRLRSKLLEVLAAAMLLTVFLLVTFAVPRFAMDDSAKGLIEKADAAGYLKEKVVDFRDIDHGLEFYAAGRLVREPDGTQRAFETPAEIAALAAAVPSRRVLVVTHNWHVDTLTDSEILHTETLGTYGEWTILSAEPSN